ncbi:MAG: DUF2726 domain-containing protein [Rhizobiaceae bacterium]|nr:MAG: DUF2726 domain-containing protein [Rhizobiaceae bacterium]CAG1003375.1 hypothetical protein RHIZO_03009 [Rhizobiaceae bacterium]
MNYAIAVLFIAVGMFCLGMGVERYLGKRRRRAWVRNNRLEPGLFQEKHVGSFAPWNEGPAAAPATDAASQLRIVMSAHFSPQPLLNRSEARLFRELDRLVLGLKPDWQVMAQVSLGEILRSPQAAAYGCINSKRVDLLIVDEHCQPRHVIEYQGGGHHQGTAAARDAVKKEALRRAGIGYHEIVGGSSTPSDLKRLVEKLVNPATQAVRP